MSSQRLAPRVIVGCALICALSTFLLRTHTATLEVDASGALLCEAEVEVSVTQDDGSLTTQRMPATRVIPGDEVIFTLHYRNYGTQPAEDVFITNPVPQHMELQGAGNLPAGLEITYSVDGGRIFGPMMQLKMIDFAGGERPAVPSDCTHIRWTFHKPLEPGATGSVGYTALFALLGVVPLAAGVAGYLFGPMGMVSRGLALVAALLILYPAGV